MIDLRKQKQNTYILNNEGETDFFYVGKGNDEFKKKIHFELKKPGINHRVNIKTVLWDQAMFDLEAIMIIKKGAKNTNSYLKIDCLLMSEKARARVIPSLEIMEDAVKSGHGATISTINPVLLNYIRSRGLNKKVAQDLIIQGFLN